MRWLAFSAVLAVAECWTRLLASAPWSGRSDPQLALLGQRLLLFGGHKNNEYYADVWASPDGGRSWTEQPAAPWAARSYHTAKLMDDGKLYMLGGHNGTHWFNDIWRTADGRSWELVNGAAPWTPRAACAVQVRRGSLYVMGGSNGLLPPIGHGTVFNDVWVSHDRGLSWQCATPAAPWPAREGLQKLTALYGEDEVMLLTAGEAGYFGPYYNDVWASVNGSSWHLLRGHAEFSARAGNPMLNVGGALFTFGGYGFPMKHDAYCLPEGGDGSGAWNTLASAPWHGRFDYDMELVNGSIVLLAGEASLFGAGGPYYNDVWMLERPTC